MYLKKPHLIFMIIIYSSYSLLFCNDLDYDKLKQISEGKRQELSRQYSQIMSEDKKQIFLSEAGEHIRQLITDQLIPPWYGTGWDFNGISQVPKEGKIACGYFVTTILRDAGFNLERVKLAQQASEYIIRSLLKPKQIKRFSDVPFESFLKTVDDWGGGLYIIGLDIHVGFVLCENGKIYFIHSSYVEPYEVVKEKASQSGILKKSRYKVLGKITDDDALLIRWLEGKKITTQTR